MTAFDGQASLSLLRRKRSISLESSFLSPSAAAYSIRPIDQAFIIRVSRTGSVVKLIIPTSNGWDPLEVMSIDDDDDDDDDDDGDGWMNGTIPLLTRLLFPMHARLEVAASIVLRIYR